MTEPAVSESVDTEGGIEGSDNIDDPTSAPTVDNGSLQDALNQAEERVPPPPAHALKHDIAHSQPVPKTNTLSLILV